MPKSLRFLKGQITKAEKKAEDMKSYSVYSLKHYLSELETDFREFKEHFSDVGDEDDELMEVFEEYEDKYNRSVSLFEEEIDKRLNRRPDETFGTPDRPNRALDVLLERQRELNETIGILATGLPKKENKLPTLKIPSFSGDFKEWVRFKNLFLNRVDQNADLNSMEKLGYLLTLVSGEASSLIKHLPFTELSYAAAWEILVSNYDKPYKISNNLIAEVIRTPPINSKLGLRTLYHKLAETLSALDSMGNYCRSRDPWIIHWMVDKLDKELRQRWARDIANENSPTLERFMEFLRQEDDALDNTGRLELDNNSKVQRNGFPGQRNAKVNSTFTTSCFVCSNNHRIFDCTKFKSMSVRNRTDLVRLKGKCLNCFGAGHFVKSCVSKSVCSKCGRKHHTLLHYEVSPPESSPMKDRIEEPPEVMKDPLFKVNLSSGGDWSTSILPTAIIQVYNSDRELVRCRALLDSGSQAAFITESCAKKLKLKRSSSGITFETMSSSVSKKSHGSINAVFCSLYETNDVFSTKMHVVDRITGCLPAKKVESGAKSLLRARFSLADPDFDAPSDIDILLSAELLFGIIRSQKYFHQIEKLWVLESSLGWLVSGGSNDLETAVKANCNWVSQGVDSLNEMVTRFWEVEEASYSQSLEDEVSYCEKLYASTTVRLPNGRYSVDLPFKKDAGRLGNSYHLARNRLYSLERKFEYNRDFKFEYGKIMRMFEAKGFIERIHEDKYGKDLNAQVYYLPHCGVGFGKSKLRIVFDASMKSENGLSLNDILCTGPNLQPDLRMLLIGFRLHKYVFVADIKKMYRQIAINQDSREVQRFLWREDGSSDIQKYRISTVTDGLVCSPFLALRTMNQLAEDEESSYPLGAKYLAKRYMDDFFIGSSSLGELDNIKNQLIGILGTATMSLGKWCSNHEPLLTNIPKEDRLDEPSLNIRLNNTIKTLGVSWNFKQDEFTYNWEFENPKKLTKRALLADSARFYDPLGWIIPITVNFKMIFQEICIAKFDWDDVLPEKLIETWLSIRNQMHNLSKIRVPRWIDCSGKIELHGFSDASGKAYACVVYCRCSHPNGDISSSIVMARSRVTPIKPLSIARLELCAANLLADTIDSLKATFEDWKPAIHCWTDSTTVLAWLAADPRKWNTFVANRCANIRRLIPDVDWRYIKSNENPADVASRGIRFDSFLTHELWWSGPNVLKTFEPEIKNRKLIETELEIKKCEVKCFTISVNQFWGSYLEKYSSFNQTVRVIAYVMRFVNPQRIKYSSIELSPSEIQDSFDLIVRNLQKAHYDQEIESMKNKSCVGRKSSLSSIDPFLDEKGLLRAGGRVSNAPLSYNARFPIILPRSRFLGTLIIHYHEKYYHADKKLLIAMLRQRFWVTGLFRMVKKIILSCKVCRVYKAQTYSPKMSAIPEFRLKPQKPFNTTGIDFAGPITLRAFKCRGKLTVKGYIALMVCMVTRALHLELVLGLDVESLINALRRFVSRRGRCSRILSDNGTNFVACSKRFIGFSCDIEKNIRDPGFQQFLKNEIIEWRFIPPASPHMGGIWESGVKSVKSLLSKKFSEVVPTIEEFMTVLAEVEALLNSRPIFANKNDDNEVEIITPSHLIQGFPTTVIPFTEKSGDCVEFSQSKRYEYLRNIIRGFWRVWSNNYYQEMRKISKWKRSNREPRVGDVVLIKRTNAPPSCWVMGRIINTYPGSDNVVRIVDVKTAHGVRKESTRNLVPLVVEDGASTGE